MTPLTPIQLAGLLSVLSGPDDGPGEFGRLLAKVLAAWGFQPCRDTWEIGWHPDGGAFVSICDRTWTGPTVADALVAALGAAP